MPPAQNEHPAVGPSHALPDSPPHRSKAVGAMVWIIVLAIFATGFWLILRKHDQSASAPKTGRGAGGAPVTLNTATAQKGDIGVYLDAIGTVTPVYTSSITSQVNGIVTTVHYREGQMVRKGDALIDIDDRTYRATLLQAQGTLERDENVLAQAQMDVQRYRDAWARNAIPKQTLDDQEKIVLQDQGTVKLDQGTVQFDEVQVEYCHIKAPIGGKVGLRLVDPGNVVQSSGTLTLAVITQLQPITTIFTIPEDNLGQVQPRLRQNAKLAVDAYDRSGLKKIASGALLTLDNQIDTTTGTVKARAIFDNKDAALYPNEFVNVRLLVDTLKDATLIPTSAIQHNGQTAFVYVIQDGVAHMRTIKVGVTDGGTAQVTGINPGEVLANSSFDKLQDNSKVNIAGNAAPAGNTPQSAPASEDKPGNKRKPGSSAP
ncbi:MAG TPA: efflux RND transporter periplasmic adaptor subunit [Candidatus Acidoferrum sp.]|nr:efflux RND transporter periplasmic adaptor subunit [Candidatus Acidoferrum sp.]